MNGPLRELPDGLRGVTPAGQAFVVRQRPGAPVCVETPVVVGRTQTPDGKVHERVVTLEQYYVATDADAEHLLAWLPGLPLVLYDTETSGISVFEHQVATIQFGHPAPPEGHVARTYTVDVRALSPEVLARITAYLRDPEVCKLGQRIHFEGLYAEHRLGTPMRNLACTQVTELLLRAGLFPTTRDGEDGRKAYGMTSMKALCERYLHIDIDKDHDLRTSFYTTPPGQHSVRQVIYGGGDVIYPWFVFEQQLDLVRERKLRSVLEVEFGFIPVAVHQELCGIAIDEAAWRTLYQRALQERDRAERALDDLILDLQGDLFDRTNRDVRPLYLGGKKQEPINWSSPVQVRWALKYYCAEVAWPVKLLTTLQQVWEAKRVEGKEWLRSKGLTEADVARDTEDPKERGSRRTIPDWVLPEAQYCVLLDTKYDTLKLAMIRGQVPKRFVELALAYAETKSFVTTFGVDFLKRLSKHDGRIHTEVHQLITATGRMSTEPNLQNIPRPPEYRQCFKAKRGYKLVIADYSQIEPRISAFVSRDPVYVENYRKRDDLYLSIAERLYGERPDKTTPEGAERRQAAKSTVLGLAYRMGPHKLRGALSLELGRNVSLEEAQFLHSTYLAQCSGIHAFQERCATLADPEAEHPRTVWDDMLQQAVTYVTSPCGRHRFFPPGARNTFTESANMPIQGASATIIKAAAVRIQEHIDQHGLDAHGVNFVHDEVLYECRADQAEAFALVVKDLMEQVAAHYIPGIPVFAEFPKDTNGVVEYWAKG